MSDEASARRRLPPHLRQPQVPDPPFAFSIRDATAQDLPHIREIYNHYVTNSTVTFDEQQQTLAEVRAKFRHATQLGHPFLVAVSPSGQILGYATVSPWKQKAAYRYTVENSIYLRAASTGKGLGTALMAELLARAKAVGIREVVAVIADQGAEASIAMHRSFGFTEVGRMGRVGFKFNRWLGTVLMQKSLR